jgi:hypothetical protein
MTRKVRDIMSAAPVRMAGDLALDRDERSALSEISATAPDR